MFPFIYCISSLRTEAWRVTYKFEIAWKLNNYYLPSDTILLFYSFEIKRNGMIIESRMV
jgi:hypothetical protein